MALVERICGVCEKPFAASRKDARYCSDRCRQLAKRRPGRTAGESVHRGVREQILHDLTRAGRADTFFGQLALELAGQVCAPDATAVAALSAELRRVMVLALQGSAQSGGGGGDPAQPVDQVAKARAARDRKTRHAAG